MGGALNRLLQANGKAPIPLEHLRPHISDGTPALLRTGFGCRPGEPRFADLRARFLEIYEDNLCNTTALFPGIDAIVSRLNDGCIPWGIVTNKPERLTCLIMRELGLDEQAACIIGGDSLIQRKPHPLPVIHACKVAGADVQAAIFIGDSIRDVIAGNQAGTDTMGVTYGYIPPGDDPTLWNATYLADSVQQISRILWQK